MARRELARRRFLDFGLYVYPGFSAPAHIQAIGAALEGVESGRITRLMVSCPPRHGKSLATSVLFPTWYLGRNPNRRVIATSYGADLSQGFSREALNIIKSPEYARLFPHVGIAPDARAVDEWRLADPTRNHAPYNGMYVASSVGGALTGRGADLLLVDDPVKDDKEARSRTVQQHIWDWYVSTALTRLHPGGAIVLIMTRWAEDDLAGRLQELEETDPRAERWHKLILPAIAEENDPMGRETGEALWPGRYNVDELEKIRIPMGARAWSALYQQRPSPAEGAIFKREWWQWYDSVPRHRISNVIQVWDTAFSVKTSADYSVCATWGISGRNAFLLDLWRGRAEFPDLTRIAADLAFQWRPQQVCIENKASGQSLVQAMRRVLPCAVIGIDVKPGDDKVSRANVVTPFIEEGRVFLPKHHPLIEDFVEEHAAFDAGAHDDMVDTTAHALARIFGRGGWTMDRTAVSGPRPLLELYDSKIRAVPYGRSQNLLPPPAGLIR